MTPLIALTGVSKVYAGAAPRVALDAVDLHVEAGEFAAVVRPSGSGKSTLLHLVAGLERSTQGTVLVDGRDLGRMGEAALARFRRDRVGVIFQFFHLLDTLSAEDNVLLPARLAGVAPATARARARQLLDRLGVAHVRDTFPAHLSGGEQQRVAIARALVNQPALLLADEPTGALDSRSGKDVMRLLEEINGAGQTVLLVTHEAALAASSARRIIQLRDGRILDDTPLSAASASRAAAFLHLSGGL